MGREASDASTDRFRRGGVSGAHHGLRRARGAASRPGLRHSLFLPVLLLPAFAGCVPLPEGPATNIDSNFWLTLLGLLAVAIGFILLAAGVRIKIPWLGSFRPPESKNWTGRIFLAVLGVSLSLAVLYYYGYGRDVREQDVNDSGNVTFASRAEERAEAGTETGVEDISGDTPERTPVVRLSGTVSSITAYGDAFENYHSTLRIGSGWLSEESEATVDRDGRFTVDVPSRSTVTWRAVEPSEYVLWPMEIDPPAERSGSSANLSFEFLKINDLFARQKDKAIRAIRKCKFERADAVLNALLSVLEQLDDSVSQAQMWPHDVHRDLANAVKHRDCADGDGGSSMSFERKWRRGAIERATTPKEKILAMNMWAGLSREMYRPQGLAWPDATLVDVDLVSEGYRDSLREDLQLVKPKLARPEIRDLVSNEIVPPGIGDCLDVGQREALRAFETLLSEPVRGVNLNRLMNAISGLQRIVTSWWPLGTWIDYPGEGDGEIRIIREWKVDRFEYRFRFTQYGRSELGGGKLTLEPEQSAPCRFGIRGASSDRRNREFFVILEDGFLQREPAGLRYPAKRGSAESPGG